MGKTPYAREWPAGCAALVLVPSSARRRRAGPAEDERVAALEPGDMPPGGCVLNEELIDLSLAELVGAGRLSGADVLRGGQLTGQRRIGKAIGDDNVGTTQRLPAADGDEIRAARPGADKRDRAG
jgi:hypothetical protein